MTIAVALKVHDGLVLAADSASTLMGRDPAGGSSGVINVYNTANKIFNLKKGFPVGAVTWGSGSIGPASISTLAKDLRDKFSGRDADVPDWQLDYDSWELEYDSYSVREVADKLRAFMYEEHYAREFGEAQYKPPLSFLVGGYSSKERLAEEYLVAIQEGGECPEPKLVSGPQDAEEKVFWGGQPEAINRLVAGYGEALPNVLTGYLGLPNAQVEQAMDIIESELSTPLVHPAMPIQDAIDLADFLVNLTIGYSRFSPGAPSVGGPIEIAAITKHERFKWVRRKHYFNDKLNPSPQ